MSYLWQKIAAELEGQGTCALVTVARAEGSTPREQGARMVVSRDGSISGSIGGGTLEFQASQWAADAMAQEEAGLLERVVSLGPDLGQCCGGRLSLAVEVLVASQLEQSRLLARLEKQGTPFSTHATVEQGKPLHRLVVPGETVGPPFALEGDTLVEYFGAAVRPLWLFGAGHVGRAVVLALSPLPFRITWVDSRSDMFPKVMPGDLLCMACDRPASLLADAPRDAFVLVMTHSHAVDEDIIAEALRQNRFPYVGMIGSETKRARFTSRLGKRGVGREAVAQLVCPVGQTAVKSKQPAAIAAGIAVELLVADEAARDQERTSRALVTRLGLG